MSEPAAIEALFFAPDSSRTATGGAVERAKAAGCGAVIVLPCWVADAVASLENSETVAGTVIGWPHGVSSPQAKAIDAATAAADGALALTLFVNLAALKSGVDEIIVDEISSVVDMAAPAGAVVRVALDLAKLAGAERGHLARLAMECGADGIVVLGGGVTEIADLCELLGEDAEAVVWHPAQGVTDDALLDAGAVRIGRRG